MGFFGTRAVRKFFDRVYLDNDNNKVDGRGNNERYLQSVGYTIDDLVQPKVEELKYLRNVMLLSEETLSFFEKSWGIDLIIDNNLERRKRIASYWLQLVHSRSTPVGVKATFYLATYELMDVISVEILVDYANPIPAAGINASYEFVVKITTNLLEVPFNLDAYYKAIEWHIPVNLIFKGIIINDTYIPYELFFFTFNSERVPKLTYDNGHLWVDKTKQPQAIIEVVSGDAPDNGHLQITAENAEFLLLDNLYGFGQGRLTFYKPTNDALPFFSVSRANTITNTSFVISWGGFVADEFFLVVGKKRSRLPNRPLTLTDSAITERHYDFVSVGTSLNTSVLDLDPNTAYWYQVWAEKNGKRTFSNIEWVITTDDLLIPIAQSVNELTLFANSFIASWTDSVNNKAIQYQIQVATDSAFSNILITETVGNITAHKINNISIPCYFRVRTKDQDHFSAWSNIIFVDYQEFINEDFDTLDFE